MTRKLSGKDEKDDTGYYTPKNILNPAMFRLAEITRELSEVNMKVEQEKLLDERRHTINIEEISHAEPVTNEATQGVYDTIEVLGTINAEIHKSPWVEMLKKNEDEIARILIISLAVSIGLLILMLVFWS